MTSSHLVGTMNRSGMVRARRPFGRASLVALLAFACVAGATLPARAATQDAAVAGVMGRFLQFVTWPEASFASRNAPLVVGVFGRPSQAEAIHRVVMGRSNAGHPIEVRMLKKVSEVHGCHLLYIDNEDRSDMAAIVAATAGTSAITVSDMPGFLGEGGNVALVVENKRAAFDVNLTAAEQSGVRISSRLLQVARAVLRAGM